MDLIHAIGAYNLDQALENNPILKQYLDQRGLTKDLITDFKIGYLDQNGYEIINRRHDLDQASLINLGLINEKGRPIYHNRLIFPIYDRHGNAVAISGRTLGDVSIENVKYLHSKSSRIFQKDAILYHYDKAQSHKKIYLCEGFMDVIALKRCNYDNAIALMGLDYGPKRLAIFNQHDLIICFDQDQAGRQATFNLVQKLIATHRQLQVVSFDDPQAKDIDELSLKNPELARQVLANPLAAHAFAYQFCFQNLN